MPAGVPDAALSTVLKSPLTAILADNTTVMTVTVTLIDSEMDPVPAHGISGAATLNGGGVTVTGPAGGVTDANGEAVFTVKSTTIHPSPDITQVTFTAAGPVVLEEVAEIEFIGGFVAAPTSMVFSEQVDGPPRANIKVLQVVSTPTLAEVTAAKVGGAAWLTIPATFTDSTDENVQVDCPGRRIFNPGKKTETIRFSQAGYTSLDVLVTMLVMPGGHS